MKNGAKNILINAGQMRHKALKSTYLADKITYLGENDGIKRTNYYKC